MAKKLSLNTQILIGCAAGIAGGLFLQTQGATPAIENTLYGARMVGNLFLDLLRMVLVPLVFSSIVVGVANLRAHDQMHRVWTTTLAFFFATMGIAIVIGFGAAHLFRPGDGLQLEMFADGDEKRRRLAGVLDRLNQGGRAAVVQHGHQLANRTRRP